MKKIFQKLLEKDENNDSPMSSNDSSQNIHIDTTPMSPQNTYLQEKSMYSSIPSSPKNSQEHFPSSPTSFTSSVETSLGLSIEQLQNSCILDMNPFHDSQFLEPITLCPSSPSNTISYSPTQSPSPSHQNTNPFSNFHTPCQEDYLNNIEISPKNNQRSRSKQYPSQSNL